MASTVANTTKHREELADRGKDLRESMTHVKDDLRDLASTAGEVAREQFEPIESYIRNRPMTAVLIGAGVGLIMGFILRGR